MIKIYRKTATIKAEQFDGSDEMARRYGAELYSESGYGYDEVEGEPDGDGYVLITPEGESLVSTGNWIATDVNGKHWLIADEVFKKTYAELPVIPKAVADWIDKCKHDGASISFAMYEDNFPKKVADYFRIYYTRDQWIELQDNFARAWLDGYTVEKNK